MLIDLYIYVSHSHSRSHSYMHSYGSPAMKQQQPKSIKGKNRTKITSSFMEDENEEEEQQLQRETGRHGSVVLKVRHSIVCLCVSPLPSLPPSLSHTHLNPTKSLLPPILLPLYIPLSLSFTPSPTLPHPPSLTHPPTLPLRLLQSSAT